MLDQYFENKEMMKTHFDRRLPDFEEGPDSFLTCSSYTPYFLGTVLESQARNHRENLVGEL